MFGTSEHISAQNLLNYNIRMQENFGLQSCLHFISLQGRGGGEGGEREGGGQLNRKHADRAEERERERERREGRCSVV